MEDQTQPDINKVVSETSPKNSHKVIKYIVMGIFIILPFVGFYLGMEYEKSIDSSEKPPYATIAPEEIVNEETYCTSDNDCVRTSYTYECCGAPCGDELINRMEFEKRKQWTIDNCKEKDYEKCPSYNCSFDNKWPLCRNNMCTLVEISPTPAMSQKQRIQLTEECIEEVRGDLETNHNLRSDELSVVFNSSPSQIRVDKLIEQYDIEVLQIYNNPNVIFKVKRENAPQIKCQLLLEPDIENVVFIEDVQLY